MKYSRLEALKQYCLLIVKRIREPISISNLSITEVHHIIPRCVCCNKRITEAKHNLIRLYAHEHFLAHYYLTFIFPHNIGAHRAFYLMSNIKSRRKFKTMSEFAYAYETAKAKVKANRKDKTYYEIYGVKEAERIKIKQKKSKLDQMIRFIKVDK